MLTELVPAAFAITGNGKETCSGWTGICANDHTKETAMAVMAIVSGEKVFIFHILQNCFVCLIAC